LTYPQVMSHHFGIGNLSLDNLTSPKSQNKATNVESSGKFKQQLLAKQKQLEEMLLKNRVMKLQKDEDFLMK